MTEEQIHERRRQDRLRVGNGDKYFNRELEDRYKGFVPTEPTETEAHYLYHAELARSVAEKKHDKKVRRYWNRQARKYDAQAERLRNRGQGNGGTETQT